MKRQKTTLPITLLRTLAVIFGLAWAGLFGYAEFFIADFEAGTRSPEVWRKMETCSGSFQERYDCRSAILLADQRSSVLVLFKKSLIVFGPPIMLGFLVSWTGRRRDKAMVPHDRHRHTVSKDSPFRQQARQRSRNLDDPFN